MIPTKPLPDYAVLGELWQLFSEACGLPADYDGTATDATYSAIERAQEMLRNQIVESGDKRLFSLLHLMGNASLHIEERLYPDQCIERDKAVQEALDDPSPSVPHAEAMKSILRGKK